MHKINFIYRWNLDYFDMQHFIKYVSTLDWKNYSLKKLNTVEETQKKNISFLTDLVFPQPKKLTKARKTYIV